MLNTIQPNSYHLGDCFDLVPLVPDKSVDLILCDLPYGVTQNKNDVALPMQAYAHWMIKKKQVVLTRDEFFLQLFKEGCSFDECSGLWYELSKPGLWDLYSRVIKPGGNIILFAQNGFMSYLTGSNHDKFRYDIVWNKKLISNHMNAPIMPLRQHENILIFGEPKAFYNPIMTRGNRLHSKGTKHLKVEAKNQNYGKIKPIEDRRKGSKEKYPTTIVTYQKPASTNQKHRTQKPVPLLSWLIRTYCPKGGLVMDNCAGSFGVGIAAYDAGMQYILIEKDEYEYNNGVEHLEKHIKMKQHAPEIAFTYKQ